MLPILTLAVLNDLLTAELLSPMDVMAPPINVTAPFMDVTAPLPINVMAPSTNITAPSIKATAAINYSRDLATLAKIYTEESKYSKEDDNFNHKLTIFNNLYNRVKILQAVKIKGFLIMLCSITLNFYYKNKATYTTFNNIYNTIHNYFKRLEYKHKVLTK